MTRPKRERLLDLRLQVQACVRCPYARVREQPLIGDGDYRSPILIIGDKPRQRDDKDEEIYSGRAGKKLEKMLSAAELNIKQTYRTYVIRCFPGREPKFGEFSAFKRCSTYTTEMIKIMRPTAIVISGYKVFKWMIVRWTREVVDEHSFYRWVGRTVRLKELWGEMKFFIIESPAVLSNARNPELEAKSIDVLKEMKAYVVAKQKDEPVALEMVDLKRRPHTKSKQQTFGWT